MELAEALVAFRKGEQLDSGGLGFTGALAVAEACGNLRFLAEAYSKVHSGRRK